MADTLALLFPNVAVTGDLTVRVAVSFLPLAMTQIADRHIEATIFTDKLGGGARRAVLLFGTVLAIAVFALIAWGTGAEAVKQTARGAYVEAGTIHFPTWPSYWILPVSAALMLAVLAVRLVRMLTGTFREVEHDPLEEVTADVEEAR